MKSINRGNENKCVTKIKAEGRNNKMRGQKEMKRKKNKTIREENRINSCNCVIQAVFQPGNDIFPDGQATEKK